MAIETGKYRAHLSGMLDPRSPVFPGGFAWARVMTLFGIQSPLNKSPGEARWFFLRCYRNPRKGHPLSLSAREWVARSGSERFARDHSSCGKVS